MLVLGLSPVRELMLVFRGAEVYPGDGPSFRTDVGVADGRIVAIGDGLEGEVLDATGAMLCPGFIDLHAHSALAPFDDPLLAPKILQGFTTEVICPDGLAPAPVADWRARRAYLRALEGEGPAEWPWSSFAEYLDALDATRPAMTLVPSVGHGAVRDFVVGGERVPPRLDEMRREVRLAFEAGARMLSFGLVYFPGAYARYGRARRRRRGRGRVRRAARPARPQRGPRRPRGGRGDDRGRAPLGRAAPPLAPEVARGRVADRAAARARRGRPARRSTSTRTARARRCSRALLPAWAQEGGAEATLARARDPELPRADRARRRARPARLGEPARRRSGPSGSSSAAGRSPSSAATRSRRCSTCSSRRSSRRR